MSCRQRASCKLWRMGTGLCTSPLPTRRQFTVFCFNVGKNVASRLATNGSTCSCLVFMELCRRKQRARCRRNARSQNNWTSALNVVWFPRALHGGGPNLQPQFPSTSVNLTKILDLPNMTTMRKSSMPF